MLALATLALSPARGMAAEIRISSRTIGEGYVVRMPGEQGQLLTRRRISQYIQLGAYELLPPKHFDEARRAPEDGQLQIVASMRVRHDFGTYVRTARGDAEGLVDALDGRQIDLMFGYLEGRAIGRWLDFRAGRQFEMSGLDFYAFDGGWVRVRTPAHLAVETFAGFAVDGEALFGFPTFELDGTSGTPRDNARSPTLGAALSIIDLSFLDARFAYRRTFTPRAINRDLPDIPGGGHLDEEIASATVALHFPQARMHPFASIRYNIGTARLDDVSAGVTWALTDRHLLRLLYLRTIPTFDLDSIWNVFAAEPFEDVRIDLETQVNPAWRLYSRFQGRIFLSQDVLDGSPTFRERTAFGGGGSLGTSYRRGRFSLLAEGFGLGGYGGLRAGGQIDTRTFVLYRRIAIDGRAYAMFYRDEETRERSGHSAAVQAGMHFELAPGIWFDVVGEELFTPYHRHALRMLGILSFDWRFRAGRR